MCTPNHSELQTTASSTLAGISCAQHHRAPEAVQDDLFPQPPDTSSNISHICCHVAPNRCCRYAPSSAGVATSYQAQSVPVVPTPSGSDLLVQMRIVAPEQLVAIYSNDLRAVFANATQTPADSIYIYSASAVNAAGGSPSLDVSKSWQFAALARCPISSKLPPCPLPK